MMAVASQRGLTLVFKSSKDLERTIRDLKSMLRAKNGRGYPAAYLLYEPLGMNDQQADKEMKRAKRIYRSR